MRQVFVSYRHVSPDEQLAKGLHAYLVEKGLRVFLDTQIEVGLDWVAEIDRQLRASDAFVVFLSEESIRSDMVRQEIQTAHELRAEGKMRIFPVRVGFEGKLPYDLASYLNRIQYKLWRPGDSETELFDLIQTAITGSASLPETPSSEETAVLSPADPSVVADSTDLRRAAACQSGRHPPDPCEADRPHPEDHDPACRCVGFGAPWREGKLRGVPDPGRPG